MRRLVFSLTLLSTMPTHAQAQHHASAKPHHTAAPNHAGHSPNNAAMNFPNNSFHFPDNGALNFTNYGAYAFPNNSAVHFPNNGALNFPSNSFNIPNNGGLNFPSYNSGIANPVTPYQGGYATTPRGIVSVATPGTPAQAAAFMGMPFGVGGISSALPHSYMRGHHSRVPNHRPSVVHRPTGSSSQMTPMQRHYAKMVADLDSLVPGFRVADIHRNTLKSDLLALATSGGRPTSGAVQKLATNLAEGMARRKNPTFSTATLAGDLQTVINSGHLPQADVDRAIKEGQAMMTDAGFRRADIQAVVADLRAVVTDARSRAVAAGVNPK